MQLESATECPIKTESAPEPAASATVDEMDETIIALLEEDGRRSYGDIGRAVGLSEAAARQRVNRLRESGLIRIVAISDPLRLGRAVVATVGIRVGAIRAWWPNAWLGWRRSNGW